MNLRNAVVLAVLLAWLLPGSHAVALDQVSFGTNWKAQAEHGGFYQAVAAGIYAQHGLEVTIQPGGPQANYRQLLVAGKLDFYMAGSVFSAFNNAQNDIPTVMIAALFQKDPVILMAHPGVGHDSLPALKGKPIMISRLVEQTAWQWLKAKYGYTDDQVRPYNFNSGPFLADRQAIQQGYVSSEPFAIERQGGFEPVVFLLADHGYQGYSTLIEATRELVAAKPDLVQRFVDASIEGWYDYLYGDPTPGNALIKRDNPEMTDAQIGYSIEKMKAYGIVDSGDALTLGIGAMTEARWRRFFQFAVDAGLYPADLDIGPTYRLDFVNKKVGMAMKGE